MATTSRPPKRGTAAMLRIAALVSGYVFLSSLLGSLKLFPGIWVESVIADLWFVAASAATCVIAFGISRSRGFLRGLAVGALLTSIVYIVGYFLVLWNESPPLESFWIPLLWGQFGLFFASLAPALAGWRARKTQAHHPRANRIPSAFGRPLK